MNRKIINTKYGDYLVAGVWLPLKFTAETTKHANAQNYELGIPPIDKWIQQFQPKGVTVKFQDESLTVDQVVTTQNVTAYYFKGELVRFQDDDLGY